VNTYILIALTTALALAGARLVVALERRAASGPRPGDATVTAVLSAQDWPTEGEALITAAISNPGPVPVLVGLLLRRQLLPVAWGSTTVVYRTTRPRYQAGQQALVAAVPEGQIDRLSVPVANSGTRRRHRLVITIGQPDGRLQVVSAPVTIAPSSGSVARPGTRFPIPFPWLPL
jgi:hypothetical protein